MYVCVLSIVLYCNHYTSSWDVEEEKSLPARGYPYATTTTRRDATRRYTDHTLHRSAKHWLLLVRLLSAARGNTHPTHASITGVSSLSLAPHPHWNRNSTHTTTTTTTTDTVCIRLFISVCLCADSHTHTHTHSVHTKQECRSLICHWLARESEIACSGARTQATGVEVYVGYMCACGFVRRICSFRRWLDASRTSVSNTDRVSSVDVSTFVFTPPCGVISWTSRDLYIQ